MAATKYQILYRAFNEKLNSPIVNTGTYEPLIDMLTEDHKINVTEQDLIERYYDTPSTKEADQMRADAENAKNELITTENSKDNIKFGMLFAYNGLKKIKHKIFRPACYGWLLNEETIGLFDQAHVSYDYNDWDRDVVQINIDGKKSHVLKPDYVQKYKSQWYYEFTDKLSKFKTMTTREFEGLKQKIASESPFLTNELFEDTIFSEEIQIESFQPPSSYGAPPPPPVDCYFYEVPGDNAAKRKVSSRRALFVSDTMTSADIEAYFKAADPNIIHTWSYPVGSGMSIQYFYGIEKSTIDSLKNMGVKIFNYSMLNASESYCLTKMNNADRENSSYQYALIPEHYETSNDQPYIIKDSYVKINGDPWFVYTVRDSLNDALEVSKKLAQRFGIENVNLIKLVPLGQDIKIK